MRIVLCLTLLAGGGLLARAEQPPPNRRDRDPQSAYEPRSAPGAGQAFLEKFVGDWDVAKAFFPRSGEPVRASGKCRQTMIHGGRFLRSEFVFERDGSRTTGTGLIGFDPATGRFTSVWVDSRSTRMSLRQSREPFDGKEIVLYGASLDRSGPPTTRTVTRLEDEGRRIVHRQSFLTSGGKDRLMMELILTRKSQPDGRRP